ncbi:MAG: penicillin-binding transpeptidase domain-containing protein [Candidatus Aminicenantes bacterium]|nr:penicillin-binding transpeptidase domain-containing protein [Candidatus Aminicenantes bacterium]
MTPAKKIFKIRFRKIDRKKALKILFGAAFIGTALLLGAVFGTYVAVRKTLPDLSGLESYEPALSTKVSADDDQVVREIGTEKRTIVTYDQIPIVLRDAILATEDPHFFKHRGVDFRGVLRSVKENALNIFRRRKLHGGSTITQQVARKLFLHPLQTLQRKFAEWYVSVQIEKKYSKDRIFEMYQQQGVAEQHAEGRQGISQQSAEQTLVRQDPAGLLAQAQQLGAQVVLHQRAVERPFHLERRNHVLTRMEEEGMITPARAEEGRKKPISVLPAGREDYDFGGYFFEEVRRAIVEKYGEDALYKGGMKVSTTLNASFQKFADEAVQNGLRRYDKRHGWRRDKVNLLADETFKASGKKLEEYRLKSWVTPRLEPGDIEEAIVLEAGKKEARVKVKDYSVRLTNEGAEWAVPNKALDAILKPGDVVEVKVKSKDAEKGETIATLEQEPLAQAALVAIDPRTGQIKAMVGGSSFRRTQLNRATQTARQAGSSMKPFIYTAALEHGFTAASRIVDEPTDFPDPWSGTVWTPRNYDRKYEGMITFRTGLEESRNVITAKILDSISPQTGVDYAKRFGLTTTLYPYLSLALGTFEVNLVEMVSAYGVFPDKGIRIRPYFISRVEDRDGNLLEEHALEAEEVISPQTAYLMTHLMEGVVQRGTAAAAGGFLNDTALAGKTGTTDDYTDAWYIGFSPSLCAGVWVGNDDNSTLGRNETGAVAALPIWMEFFGRVLKDAKKTDRSSPSEFLQEEFEVPPNIHFVAIDRKTGLLATPQCKWRFMEAFLEGTEPSRLCSLLDHIATLDYAGSSRAREEH